MTKIFLDTANLKEIEKYNQWGLIKGVTTNQKIFLNEKGCNFEKQAKKILAAVYSLPVSLEGPNDYAGIIQAAMDYSSWSNNVVIKVPMLKNGEGLEAVKTLNEMGVKSNVTACMTVNQAFLAMQAGADYVSLFYCRMKDWLDEEYALDTIKQTMNLLKDSIYTQLIIGSIRSPDDITKILSVQPDIITIPPKILEQMPQNDMTDKTLKEFEEAWTEFKKAEK